MIELVRTWQMRESGNRIKVTPGQVWRCTKCNTYFQNKVQEHKCKEGNQ